MKFGEFVKGDIYPSEPEKINDFWYINILFVVELVYGKWTIFPAYDFSLEQFYLYLNNKGQHEFNTKDEAQEFIDSLNRRLNL